MNPKSRDFESSASLHEVLYSLLLASTWFVSTSRLVRSTNHRAASYQLYTMTSVTRNSVTGNVTSTTSMGGLTITVLNSYNNVLNKRRIEYKINWERSWRLVQMVPISENTAGEKLPPPDKLHTNESTKFFEHVLDEIKIECSEPRTNSRMIGKLLCDLIKPTCVNPTFVMDHLQM